MHPFGFLFKDLKILEVATALSGPFTATFFKELGASVLKIEPPQGDVSRSWKNNYEDRENQHSIYFDAVNGHKEIMQLDLKNEDDRKKFNRHVRSTDIVITNHSRRKARQLGLDYAQLKAIQPNLILANVTGYGPTSDKPAFDMMIQADSGLLSMTGHPEGLPVKVPIPIADVIASHQLREGILCALLKRFKTGEGSEIQVTLIDSMISTLVNQAGNYLMGHRIPQPMGTLHPSIAPYGDLFKTSDGRQLILAIGSELQFTRFCSAMDSLHWVDDPKYHDNRSRVQNRQLLSREIEVMISRHPVSFWLERFKKYSVPAAAIRNLQDVLDDPSLRHMITEETGGDHPVKRVKTVVF